MSYLAMNSDLQRKSHSIEFDWLLDIEGILT
jgi:hypothetical protein